MDKQDYLDFIQDIKKQFEPHCNVKVEKIYGKISIMLLDAKDGHPYGYYRVLKNSDGTYDLLGFHPAKHKQNGAN